MVKAVAYFLNIIFIFDGSLSTKIIINENQIIHCSSEQENVAVQWELTQPVLTTADDAFFSSFMIITNTFIQGK